MLLLSQLLVILFLLYCCLFYGLPVHILGEVVAAALACVPADYFLLRAFGETEAKDDAAKKAEFLKTQVLARAHYEKHIEDMLQEASQIKMRAAQELEEAREYLKTENAKDAAARMQAAIGTMDSAQIRYCEHRAVDALVSVKAREFEKADVPISIQLTVPESLSIPSVELCAVIANLLDNALRACKDLDKAHRQVAIRAAIRSGFFVVEVRNTVPDGKRADGGKKTRAEKGVLSEHGWGLEIVCEIAQRRKGATTFTIEEGEARAVAMLGVSEH